MISKYNLTQVLLIPIHLILSGVSAYYIYVLCRAAEEGLVQLIAFFSSSVSRPNLNWLDPGLWIAIIIVAPYYAYRYWSVHSGMLLGVLSATPHFGKSKTRINDRELIAHSIEKQILINIALSTSLQLLFAFQRIRNWIPNTSSIRKRLGDCLVYATQQKRWHSITEYEDSEALDYLIRMGKIDYSSTKQLVKIK